LLYWVGLVEVGELSCYRVRGELMAGEGYMRGILMLSLGGRCGNRWVKR